MGTLVIPFLIYNGTARCLAGERKSISSHFQNNAPPTDTTVASKAAHTHPYTVLTAELGLPLAVSAGPFFVIVGVSFPVAPVLPTPPPPVAAAKIVAEEAGNVLVSISFLQ